MHAYYLIYIYIGIKVLLLCVQLPNNLPVSINSLSAEEMDFELEKGYSEMIDGKTESAKVAFSDIHKEYGI